MSFKRISASLGSLTKTIGPFVAIIVAVIAVQGWLSTHYSTNDRVDSLQRRVEQIESSTQDMVDKNDVIIEKLGYLQGILTSLTEPMNVGNVTSGRAGHGHR